VKVGEVSEMSVLGLTPQVRLRYPFLDDRLTPYLIGGVGLAITQANDGRAPVEWRGGKNGVQYTGSLGGGAEYFIADNLALGLRKVPFSGDEYTSGGETNRLNVGSASSRSGFASSTPSCIPPKPRRRRAPRRRASIWRCAPARAARASRSVSGAIPRRSSRSSQQLHPAVRRQRRANIGRY
jgi:hypothetical protein